MGRGVRALALTAAVAGVALTGAAGLAIASRPTILGLGIALLTGAVAWGHRYGPSRVLPGAIAAGIAAVVVDWIVANVLGAGYPAVAAARGAAWYPPLVAFGFAALALFDHPAANAPSPGPSVHPESPPGA